ncbi:MAG: hypothetical protein LC121_10480 [Anaerolineae bacterium]|nr:hypothetical protein [Anaerolineae bacterium]
MDEFVIALEQAGRAWIVDLYRPEMPITRIEGVGRRLHGAFLGPDGRHLVVPSCDDNVDDVIGHSHSWSPRRAATASCVSARAGSDRPVAHHRDRPMIYNARTLNDAKAMPLEVPAGVSSRARAVVVGPGSAAR